MTNWEYRVRRPLPDDAEETVLLAAEGGAGWELVAASARPGDWGRLYFRRPARPADPPHPAEEPAALLARLGKEPAHWDAVNSAHGEEAWEWNCSQLYFGISSWLPPDWYARLSGESYRDPEDRFRNYPSREAALKAAADAYRPED